MPQLPVSQLKQTVAAGGGGRVGPFIQPDRALQRTGAGVASLAEQLGQINDVWQKARVTNQYTVARNDRTASVNDILSRAKSDPDHTNWESYDTELDTEMSKDITIDDNFVKERYDSEAGLAKSTASIRLREMFRNKLVVHQRGEIIRDRDASHEEYINSGMPKVREDIVRGYKDRLEASKDAGYMNNAEYLSELKDMDDWEYDRAVKMVADDPEAALGALSLGHFNIEDGNKKDEIIRMAKANIFRQQKIEAISILQTQNKNEADISQLVYEDATIPMSKKIDAINKMQGLGEISPEFAANARRFLIYRQTAKKSIDINKNNKDKERIIRMSYDIGIRYRDDMNAENFLKGVKNIQMEIMSIPNLTTDDRAKLQRELSNLTKKQQGEASLELSSGFNISKRGDIYKQAADFFDRNLPVHVRGEAIRGFFNVVTEMPEGKIKEKKLKEIIQSVSYKVAARSRKALLDAFDIAIEREGRDADLRMKRDPKTGKIGIILYDEDGKRVRLVGVVGGKKPTKEEVK